MNLVTMSPEFAELAKAVCAAQAVIAPSMKGRTVEVTTRGGDEYSYAYAELDDVWMSCRDALTSNGLALFQPPATEGARVVVTTLLVHGPSGQWMRMEMDLIAERSSPQAIGSAITYARRYSLMGLIGLVAKGEDDDARQAEQKPRQETRSPVPAPPRPPTFEEIETMLKDAEYSSTVQVIVKRHIDPIAEGNADHPLKISARARFKELKANETKTAAAGGAA